MKNVSLSIIISFAITTLVMAQEMEVDGNLKLQGALIFQDNSQIITAPQMASGIPTGSIITFVGTIAPSGWLLCDGTEFNRSIYPDLFAVIGTAYGAGDGSTTFGLPDLRGRMALGLDNMGGTSADRVTNIQADAMGGADGEENHLLTVEELAAHTHTVEIGSLTLADGWEDATTTNSGPITSSSTGGDQAHNNMPPFMALNYLIKY